MIARYHVWATKINAAGDHLGNLRAIGTGRTIEDVVRIASRRLIPRGMSDYARMGTFELFLQVEDEDGCRSLHQDMPRLWRTDRWSNLPAEQQKEKMRSTFISILHDETGRWQFPRVEAGVLTYAGMRSSCRKRSARIKYIWRKTASFSEAESVCHNSQSSRVAARRGRRFLSEKRTRELAAQEKRSAQDAMDMLLCLAGPTTQRKPATLAAIVARPVTVEGTIVGVRSRLASNTFQHTVEYHVSFANGVEKVWLPADKVTIKGSSE